MQLLQKKLPKKLSSLIGIIGLSAAIAITGYTQVNPKAIATNITQNPLPGTNQLTQLDRLYATEAAQAGMAEVEMAKLALQKSQDNKVKDYAQQMIKDHTPVNQELMQLAKQKGITPPTDIGAKYQAVIAQLSKLSGTNFDQAYITEAGINGHMENLILHSRLLQLGQDQDLKAFAIKNMPLIEAHLQLIEKLFPSPTEQGE